jgi:hypothetical protein
MTLRRSATSLSAERRGDGRGLSCGLSGQFWPSWPRSRSASGSTPRAYSGTSAHLEVARDRQEADRLPLRVDLHQDHRVRARALRGVLRPAVAAPRSGTSSPSRSACRGPCGPPDGLCVRSGAFWPSATSTLRWASTSTRPEPETALPSAWSTTPLQAVVPGPASRACGRGSRSGTCRVSGGCRRRSRWPRCR